MCVCAEKGSNIGRLGGFYVMSINMLVGVYILTAICRLLGVCTLSRPGKNVYMPLCGQHERRIYKLLLAGLKVYIQPVFDVG